MEKEGDDYDPVEGLFSYIKASQLERNLNYTPEDSEVFNDVLNLFDEENLAEYQPKTAELKSQNGKATDGMADTVQQLQKYFENENDIFDKVLQQQRQTAEDKMDELFAKKRNELQKMKNGNLSAQQIKELFEKRLGTYEAKLKNTFQITFDRKYSNALSNMNKRQLEYIKRVIIGNVVELRRFQQRGYERLRNLLRVIIVALLHYMKNGIDQLKQLT